MAEIYKICVNNLAVNTTVNISVPASYSTRVYTNGAGCTVREQTKVVTFTSSVPSDDNFRIFYSYTVDYREDFQDDGIAPLIRSSFVTMPAGATSVTREVYHYIREDCPVDTGGGSYTYSDYPSEL